MGGSHGESFRLSINSEICSTVRQVSLSDDDFTVPRSVQVITGQPKEGFPYYRKEMDSGHFLC